MTTRALHPWKFTAHGDSVELGNPKNLFAIQSSATTQLELSPDGQRLLMIQAPVQDSANLTLVVNWRQELKK